jgi:hypothetical protein
MASDDVKYRHCTNCGKRVTGDTADAAANPVVKFCSYSGDELTGKGTCPNRSCPYYKRIPPNA